MWDLAPAAQADSATSSSVSGGAWASGSGSWAGSLRILRIALAAPKSTMKAAGLFRKGAWPGVQPRRWTVYPELTEKVHVASDHHVIWAEID